MLAMPLTAQAASYTYINQQAPYKNPTPPMLTALNLPRIGQTFRIQVPEGNIGRCCWLAFGVSNPNVPIPAWGGYLFTSSDIVMLTPFKFAAKWRMTTMSFPIPNSLQLLGARFYQQVLHKGSCGWTHCPVFFNLSRGGIGVIGR